MLHWHAYTLYVAKQTCDFECYSKKQVEQFHVILAEDEKFAPFVLQVLASSQMSSGNGLVLANVSALCFLSVSAHFFVD